MTANRSILPTAPAVEGCRVALLPEADGFVTRVELYDTAGELVLLGRVQTASLTPMAKEALKYAAGTLRAAPGANVSLAGFLTLG